MGHLDTKPGISREALKAGVEEHLGHDVYVTTSRDELTLSYGMARVRIPNPNAFEGVIFGRPEGKGYRPGSTPEEYFVSTADVPNWMEVVIKTAAGVLATGRTVECGPGIGMDAWAFSPDGRSPVSEDWERLVEYVEGTADGYAPWALNPDYQRGPVWTPEQQERFIGHCLSGGLVPNIYVQRYESGRHAPPEYRMRDRWLNLPCEVIDGQQRLRAIVAFMKGDIGAQVFHDGQWHTYFYSQMNEVERRRRYLSSSIVYMDLSRPDRIRFYLRLNSGIAHTEAELDRVRRMLVEEGTHA